MKKIEVLKLSPYCYPEQISSSHLTEDLNVAFKDAGFHTTVYAPTPCRGIDVKTREKYKRIKHIKLLDGSIDIYRFSLFKEGKNPIGRAARYILCNIIQYHKGVCKKGIDIIYSGSTPPTQGLLCGKVADKLSKKYGHKVPFIYNLQDIFPDSLVNAKMTKKGSLIWKIGRIIEDYTYRKADKIITISEDFKANIMAKGVPESKIVVVPNWINTDNVYPVERKDNILFDRYGLDRSKFYICYSGNIGHSQNLGLLYRAAIRLQKEMPDVCFVLIGEGAAKEKFEQKIKEKGLTNIIVLPFQPYEDIAHVFSLGDVGLIISKPGIGNSSVPSKTWSIMAANKPILASFDEESELSRLIIAEKCGLCSNPKNVDDFIEKLLSLKSQNTLAEQMGKNGHKYVSKNLNKEKCTSIYISELKSIIKKDNS